MTMFEEFDEYLSQEYNINYWSDDAIDYAYDLIQKMTPSDWNALKSCWRDRPGQWQYYCAQVISRADSGQAIPLLIEMIQIPDDELAVTAADSLRSLDTGELDLEVDATVVDRLKALAQAHPGLAARVVNDLLRRLQLKR